ncbi:glycosyltransferase family 2 protein [Psychroserpens mesophilus]|uniref:glycosyltransferase family 2 protein n=1 Tax=Psychroserpens mesophilus TaxID=325473 RepID=UPI003D648E65
MLFHFLKYLQPTHYFQHFKKNGTSVFPIVDKLPEDLFLKLKPDLNFQSKKATEYDLSWQSIQSGYIGNAKTYLSFEKLSAQDNYHFLRKYFNTAWVYYVLMLRLMSFHNPVREISAFWKTRTTKRVVETIPVMNNGWDHFNANMIVSAPKVSVVIPTLNRYVYLKDVLEDLERQDYKNFEVIIVDQSSPFKAEFYNNFNLNINLIRQEEKALWLARNTAIRNAKGSLIALSEDDVRIKANWISSHLKCLEFFDAQVSAGVFYPKGSEIPTNRSFFALASQFATGNAMLYKDVFKKVGLFDRQFEKQRMGDGEFGMRIFLEDIKSVSNPFASCIDIKAGTGGLREMGSWDAFRTASYFAPRPIPSVLYFFRTYFGNKAARLALLRNVPLSIFPYRLKKNKPLLLLGVFCTIFLLPVVCYQVYKSWRLSSKKIKEGALIETL